LLEIQTYLDDVIAKKLPVNQHILALLQEVRSVTFYFVWQCRC